MFLFLKTQNLDGRWSKYIYFWLSHHFPFGEQFWSVPEGLSVAPDRSVTALSCDFPYNLQFKLVN
jgi:hypothetical protein